MKRVSVAVAFGSENRMHKKPSHWARRAGAIAGFQIATLSLMPISQGVAAIHHAIHPRSTGHAHAHRPARPPRPRRCRRRQAPARCSSRTHRTSHPSCLGPTLSTLTRRPSLRSPRQTPLGRAHAPQKTRVLGILPVRLHLDARHVAEASTDEMSQRVLHARAQWWGAAENQRSRGGAHRLQCSRVGRSLSSAFHRAAPHRSPWGAFFNLFSTVQLINPGGCNSGATEEMMV